jgi:CBS domain-containing protein
VAHVSDILEAKGSDVLHIESSATVFEAIKRMVNENVGSLLVIERGKLRGIVTERDYLRRVAIQGRNERDTLVRDIMSAPIIYVSPETSIEQCMAVMTERRIRHLPVLDEDHDVVGLISIGDVVKFQSKQQTAQIQLLTDYISSA